MAMTFNRIVEELIKDNQLFTSDKLYAQLVDSNREENTNIMNLLNYNGPNKEFLIQNLVNRLRELFNKSKPENLIPILNQNSGLKLYGMNVISSDWFNSNILPQIKKETELELIKKIENSISGAIEFFKQIKYNELYPIDWVNDSLFEKFKNTCIGKLENKSINNSDIKNLNDYGLLSEGDLMKFFSKNEIDEILEKPVNHFKLGDWSNVPELLKDRTDIFVLGTPSAGKSIFLSGMLYYMKIKLGNLDIKQHNLSGNTYADQLVTAVSRGSLPPPTPPRIIQHIPCDVTTNSGYVHPLTFIEMSGEIFKNIYGENVQSINEKEGGDKLIQYLFSGNKKILFLCIDYVRDKREDYDTDTSQGDILGFSLGFLEGNEILSTVDGICLIITKWDLSNGEAVNSVIDKKYLNLYNKCEKLAQKFDIPFEVFTFSIGDFDKRGKYTYNQDYSKKIYEWISGATRPINQNKSNNSFLKIFKKKKL
jgi:hypothetical protein